MSAEPSEEVLWLQAGWGKCDDAFMTSGNFCQITCGRCSSCTDVAPDSVYTCAQQVSESHTVLLLS